MIRNSFHAWLPVCLLLCSSMMLAQNTVPHSSVAQFVPSIIKTGPASPVPPKKTPPSYCNPCLFYGGDLDPNNSNADTFANENILPGGNPLIAQIYSPFWVPKNATWIVTGLFINSLSYPTALDPVRTPWEIRRDIPGAGGSGGKLIAHGTANATMTATGRNINGTPEYTILLMLRKPITLKSGVYWQNITPQCTDPNNSECTAQGLTGFLESDMETQGGFNGYGPKEPWDRSFWNAPDFGLTWQNVFEVCQERHCPGGDAFSAGVIGSRQ